MNYWLLKTEPATFSIDDLDKAPEQITSWEGVRNYQARNLLKTSLQVGDLAFFYHSSCKQPGIVGVIKIVKGGYPDNTALDVHSQYYDSKHTKENPRWYCVDVQLVRKMSSIITLTELRQHPLLKNMILLRKGNRLSVMPVTKQEWEIISQLE